MKIKVTSKKCFASAHKRSWQKLANHVASHYPKDSALHQAVRDAFKAFDASAMQLTKSAPKPAKRATAKHSPAKRRTVKRKTKTAKRAPAKERTSHGRVKRHTPRRHTAKRRVAHRRAA